MSPFLKLSAELRNRIYGLVLETDQPHYTGELPGLLGTCKQIRDESIGLYFGSPGGFKVSVERSKPSTLTKWLENQDVDMLKLITTIEMSILLYRVRDVSTTLGRHRDKWQHLCCIFMKAGLLRVNVEVDFSEARAAGRDPGNQTLADLVLNSRFSWIWLEARNQLIVDEQALRERKIVFR